MPENTPEIDPTSSDAPDRPTYTVDGREVSYEEFLERQLLRSAETGEAKFIQTATGFLMNPGDEQGTHEEMLEATEGWKDVVPLEEAASGDVPAWPTIMVDGKPVDQQTLEALLGEMADQVRGPLHYRGDVAAVAMHQLVGPDRTGEALVPLEATYSIETGLTEVFYRVATPDDVAAHVAAVGRSMA